MTLLGNTISLVGSILFFASSIAKTKKSMLRLQIVETIVSTISCLVLGGLSGALVNLIAFVRNTLAYREISSKLLTLGIVSSLCIINILTNLEGWIGWIPIIASTEYTICMMLQDVSHKVLRASLGVNVLLWLVYSWIIHDYVSTITFAIIILSMAFKSNS